MNDPSRPIATRGARRRFPWSARAILLLVLLLAADYALYPYLARAGGHPVNRGENGLWLRYRWYFGQRSEADIRGLARTLMEKTRISFTLATVPLGTLADLKPLEDILTALGDREPGLRGHIAAVMASMNRVSNSTTLGRFAISRSSAERMTSSIAAGISGTSWRTVAGVALACSTASETRLVI